MSELEVHIVKLEPMRVASAYGFGENPEEQAWKKLDAWAANKGLLTDRAAHPIFGFNNPNPSATNPKYGYEFWMKVDPTTEPSGDIRVVEFTGGTYAVLRCDTQGNPGQTMPAAWQALAGWCKLHNHRFGRHHALERIVSGADNPENLVVDLYCPVVE